MNEGKRVAASVMHPDSALGLMQHRDFPYDKVIIPTDCQSSVLSELTHDNRLCVEGSKLKKRAVLDTEKCNARLRRRKLFRIVKKIVALSRGPATPKKQNDFFGRNCG